MLAFTPRPPANPLMGLYFSDEARARLAGRSMILGFGAQKAGSSWLYNRLALSPEVLAARLKEWHFFDCWLRPDLTQDIARIVAGHEERVSKRRPDGLRAQAFAARREALTRPEAYLDFFAARIGDRKAMLDISPDYALLEAEDMENVAAYFNAAGVHLHPVFIMRDPVERLFSYARALAEARNEDPVKIFRKSFKAPLVMARSRYETTLQALWSAFSRERVVVGFYETLTGDEAALAALAARLGLAPPPPAPPGRVNPSPAARLPGDLAAEARERLAGTYNFLSSEFGSDLPVTWR